MDRKQGFTLWKHSVHRGLTNGQSPSIFGNRFGKTEMSNQKRAAFGPSLQLLNPTFQAKPETSRER